MPPRGSMTVQRGICPSLREPRDAKIFAVRDLPSPAASPSGFLRPHTHTHTHKRYETRVFAQEARPAQRGTKKRSGQTRSVPEGLVRPRATTFRTFRTSADRVRTNIPVPHLRTYVRSRSTHLKHGRQDRSRWRTGRSTNELSGSQKTYSFMAKYAQRAFGDDITNVSAQEETKRPSSGAKHVDDVFATPWPKVDR